MLGTLPLHHLVHVRLIKVYGEPMRDRCDLIWTIDPRGKRAPINILLNGSAQQPVVWIFDPYDSHNGVFQVQIIDRRQIDAFMAEIERRVAVAEDNGAQAASLEASR